MVSRSALALIAIFDCFFRAIVDAGHAMCTIYAPDRPSADQIDVFQWADLFALPTGDTAVCGVKIFRFDKGGIEKAVHHLAFYLSLQRNLFYWELDALADRITDALDGRLCIQNDFLRF